MHFSGGTQGSLLKNPTSIPDTFIWESSPGSTRTAVHMLALSVAIIWRVDKLLVEKTPGRKCPGHQELDRGSGKGNSLFPLSNLSDVFIMILKGHCHDILVSLKKKLKKLGTNLSPQIMV